MKKLTVFHLEHCPYCRNAKKAVAELLEENPAYAELELSWLEESKEPEIAEQYDYYYVPSVFRGEEKLYECDPSEDYAAIKNNLKTAFDKALA